MITTSCLQSSPSRAHNVQCKAFRMVLEPANSYTYARHISAVAHEFSAAVQVQRCVLLQVSASSSFQALLGSLRSGVLCKLANSCLHSRLLVQHLIAFAWIAAAAAVVMVEDVPCRIVCHACLRLSPQKSVHGTVGASGFKGSQNVVLLMCSGEAWRHIPHVTSSYMSKRRID